MFLLNVHETHRHPLDARDAAKLDGAAAADVAQYLANRPDYKRTPLHALHSLAHELNVAEIFVKDEGPRFGLGSFKALGGAYAVARVVLAEASRILKRELGYSDMLSADVRSVAETLTVCCATAGNHGRSVAQGAKLIGARCTIFVHSGVSSERAAAIARFGADVVRVEGNYDASVAESDRVSRQQGWITVSDTSWPGYEEIPGIVMQGYTALVSETLQALQEPPTHVFIQAGVGGLAGAVAGHLALIYGERRPTFIVVEPDRAACLLETARAGHLVTINPGEPTVMAMLECYTPSALAWRVLARAADAFISVEESDAVSAMNRLARPTGSDTSIVSGESGGVGLAGLIRVARDKNARSAIGLDSTARVLVVNTEGATDPAHYRTLTRIEAPEA